MRWLCWLALRGLWSRRWRTLLSLSALALSVGLVVATGSIGALMQASVVTPARLLGRPADLWIASAYDVDYDLPASVQARVALVPGVAEVQPVLRRPVRVQTPHTDTLTLLGVDPGPYLTFHDLALAAGTLPSAERAACPSFRAQPVRHSERSEESHPWAFVRDLGLGQPVTVTAPSGDVALPLTGLIEVKSLAAAQQGLVLVAPLDTVADLFGVHDALTLLEVRLAPAASPRQVRTDLEQALGLAYAVSIPSQPGQSARLWQRLVLGALVCVDGLALAGSVSLVYAVFASAARARRRQIGLLRVVGAERWRVLALLVVEAALACHSERSEESQPWGWPAAGWAWSPVPCSPGEEPAWFWRGAASRRCLPCRLGRSWRPWHWGCSPAWPGRSGRRSVRPNSRCWNCCACFPPSFRGA